MVAPFRIPWCPRVGAVALSALALPPAILPAAAPPTLKLTFRPQPGDAARAAARLEGPALPNVERLLGSGNREDVFYLTLAGGRGAAPAPLLARLRWQPGRAILTPQAPLTRGQTYRAVFDGPRLDPSLPRLSQEYRVPLDRAPSESRVTAVYPSDPELPSNVLKFYLHFSRPMAEGSLFKYARLLDGSGKPIPLAFREVELWSDDHRRVTLWIHPGRVKEAMGAIDALGPVLRGNARYTLAVLPGLPDQQGRPLAKPFRHPFRTTTVDRRQPAVDAWKLTVPHAGTRAPLVVRFPEPLDHALAARLIHVRQRSGGPVPGVSTVAADGRTWTFTPARPWPAGSYELVADGELEDLAGNSLYRPFETVAGQKPTPQPPQYRRPFAITGKQ
jgi:hypothetical protein